MGSGIVTRLAEMTAAEFTGWIVCTAAANGWLVSTPADQAAGAPTLWLVKDGALYAVLVKAERGKITEAQDEWLHALERTPATPIVWRPSSMPEAFRRLNAKAITNGAGA